MTVEQRKGPPAASVPQQRTATAITGLAKAVPRRRLDDQVAALHGFERRLTHEVRAARGRPERVRELLARLVGVRARLQEATLCQAHAQLTEAQEIEEDVRLREQALAEEARLEQSRREAEEQREFYLACLRAPLRGHAEADDQYITDLSSVPQA